MAEHTPGPWCVENPMGFELSIVEAGKQAYEWRFIACCPLPDPDDPDEGDGIEPIRRGEVEANARLIAAAPELHAAAVDALAAIRDIMDTLPGIATGGLDDAALGLEAAIARARPE